MAISDVWWSSLFFLAFVFDASADFAFIWLVKLMTASVRFGRQPATAEDMRANTLTHNAVAQSPENARRLN